MFYEIGGKHGTYAKNYIVIVMAIQYLSTQQILFLVGYLKT